MAAKKKPEPSAPDAPDEQEVRVEDVPAGSAGSYDDWSVADLRRRAKELGLSGYAKKKKSALVALLRDH
jgi:hypothetical protein